MGPMQLKPSGAAAVPKQPAARNDVVKPEFAELRAKVGASECATLRRRGKESKRTASNTEAAKSNLVVQRVVAAEPSLASGALSFFPDLDPVPGQQFRTTTYSCFAKPESMELCSTPRTLKILSASQSNNKINACE